MNEKPPRSALSLYGIEFSGYFGEHRGAGKHPVRAGCGVPGGVFSSKASPSDQGVFRSLNCPTIDATTPEMAISSLS